MSSIWKNGTIDAHRIGPGNFVSVDLQMKRLNEIRNNTTYREKLEKAQRMAGYPDKLLIIARGSNVNHDSEQALINQNKKAETLTKGKTDENTSDIVIARN